MSLLALALLAGCYRPSLDPCRVTCASDDECPSGTRCGAGGRCHPAGEPAACTAGDDGGGDGASDAAGDADVDGPSPTGAFTALAVGNEFACAIGASDRQIYCWGSNLDGQLGDGTTVRHAAAAAIVEAGPWQAVTAGAYHACGIKEGGALYCWGAASYGQVDGTQSSGSRSSPVALPHPEGKPWTAVAAGARHTCAIDGDTVMYCWGDNGAGQLGTGAGAGVSGPQALAGNGWESVTADELRTCALKTGGGGWCWGLGALGQSTSAAMANQQASATPAQIEGALVWRALAAGRGHTCGVTSAGALMCFGEEQLGELGVASGSSATPVIAQPGSDFVGVFAGPLVTCATRSGPDRLVCFGDNRQGQLGRGDRELGSQPATVAGLARVTAGGAGVDFACVLDENGAVSCWGRDDDGRCGDGLADDRFIGPAVVGLDGTVAELTSMGEHVCARTTEGRLFCWGDNESGQLGLGDRVDRATATEVARPDGMAWTSVAAGYDHTCGVAAGRLYCWGDDDYGQLGNGAAGAALTPLQIGAASDWQKVSAGGAHTCALDVDSARWCWGNNTLGALGGGSGVGTSVTAPTPMTPGVGPTAWLDVSSGRDFACGTTAVGHELWCWGDNDQRELGVAAPATSDVPLRVLEPAADWQWVATDALYGAVCGIRAPDAGGGDLWCWGYNGSYQLGVGDNTTPQAPVEVGTARDWLRVDLGANFACAISATAELHCWGANDSSQVADAAAVNVTAIPVTPTWTTEDVHELVTGWAHGCMRTATGAVRCWGDGARGQLGDGNKAHLTPQPVVRAGT